MKLVSVSELNVNALSYAISMIEMPWLVWGETIGTHHASNQIVVPEMPSPGCYSPYTSWESFGPIIEREGIHLSRDEPPGYPPHAWHVWIPFGNQNTSQGPTPLIAAMRCYVCSKKGYKVAIPPGLL